MDLIKFYNLFIDCGFKFTTDSRAISKGMIFFALKGENFNGNLFAVKALEEGASYAVVDEDMGTDPRLINVEDVLTFMQKVASFHRKCYDIPVIGICGSNGKTTSKNLIYNVLAKKYKTHCTKGNFNNHIGVPITLLQMPQDAEMAIVELGTNNPGEIAKLCQIANPNYGLITNIGKEHLEGFGTLEAVAKEESEIYHHILKNKGTAFVNQDDEWLTRMSRSLDHKVMYTKESCTNVQHVPTVSFTYKDVQFSSSLMGDYNMDNIMLAIAIGEHFNVDIKNISEAISEYIPDNNRSQLITKDSNTILLDAYNANPS
ncbi:MAG: UDP-N-acetylmuramoyl-tripeptide--D-alanyl-D-alanine ligase, partial [Bacteroidia bacterium]